MTRREWLHKNPPPKAAATLRTLFENLQEELRSREAFLAQRSTYQANLNYWSQQAGTARQANDTQALTRANSEVQNATNAIAELEKKLAGSAELTKRIGELKTELASAARCPNHGTDLVRHKNRPDDLFLCEVGPHWFLWTTENGAAKLIPVDLSKALPGLDEQMGAAWL